MKRKKKNYSEIVILGYSQTKIQRNRDKEVDRQIDKEAERQRNRDKEVDRQIDKQTEKQR